MGKNTRFTNASVSKTSGYFKSGVEKGSFGKRGLFRKVHFSRDFPENLELLEVLENPQTLVNKGESEPFSREILENIEILESLEIPPAKRPLL